MSNGVPDYRWTGRYLTAFGLHWSILLFFPAFMVSVIFDQALAHFHVILHLWLWDLITTAVYAAFLFVCRLYKLSPGEMIQYCVVRFLWRFHWKVRQ